MVISSRRIFIVNFQNFKQHNRKVDLGKFHIFFVSFLDSELFFFLLFILSVYTISLRKNLRFLSIKKKVFVGKWTQIVLSLKSFLLKAIGKIYLLTKKTPKNEKKKTKCRLFKRRKN